MFKARLREPSREFTLNITSLMDILTIILIFLIISFSTDESEVTPPKDFKLPGSVSERPVKLAIKVSISETDVRVEDKPVVRLAAGQFRTSDLDEDQIIKPLLRELKRQKARLQAGAVKAAGFVGDDEDETEVVYFEAAKGTRSDTVDRVLKTAATAGFVKFRLAVQRKI